MQDEFCAVNRSRASKIPTTAKVVANQQDNYPERRARQFAAINGWRLSKQFNLY
jgi:hypothetical protein